MRLFICCSIKSSSSRFSTPNISIRLRASQTSITIVPSKLFFCIIFRHPTKHHQHLHAPHSRLFILHPHTHRRISPAVDVVVIVVAIWCCREKAVVHVWLHNRFADAHTDCVACARTGVLSSSCCWSICHLPKWYSESLFIIQRQNKKLRRDAAWKWTRKKWIRI